MRRQALAAPWRQEEGAVLVIGMLTLALLTIIGVAATNTGSLESEIAGNEKTYTQAFYAAELALASGETVLETLTSRVALNEGTTAGRYTQGALSFDRTTFQFGKNGATPSQWQALDWNGGDSMAVADLPEGLTTLGVAPRYTIEQREFKSDSLGRGITYGESGIYYFNVAARGTGATKSTNVLLETIYAKRFQ
ncbi:MAG: PilX N-terminal domain-containing pilus assembly protein [Candidatus Tectimicrobiota bacterium]